MTATATATATATDTIATDTIATDTIATDTIATDTIATDTKQSKTRKTRAKNPRATGKPRASKPRATEQASDGNLSSSQAVRAIEIFELCKPLTKAIQSVTDYASKYPIDRESAYMLFSDFELVLRNNGDDSNKSGIMTAWNKARNAYQDRARNAGYFVSWPTLGSSGKRTTKRFIFQTLAEQEQETTAITQENEKLASQAAEKRAIDKTNEIKAMNPEQAAQFFRDDIMAWADGEKANFETLVKVMRKSYFAK